MTKKQQASRSGSKASKHVVKTTHSGSGAYSLSGASGAEVCDADLRAIIKATSVKRRTAMKVLANR